jgi:anti-sigma factor RsiW
MSDMGPDDTLLVAFVDGELDPVTADLVAARVAADPVMIQRVSMLRQSASLLRAVLDSPSQLAVPPALSDTVMAQLNGRRRWTGWRGSSRRYGWASAAAAAVVAAFIAGDSGLGRRLYPGIAAETSAVVRVMDEVAEYHSIYAAEREHLVEVPAGQQAHIEDWLGARIDYAFHVPDLSEYGLDFKGGSMLAIERKPVAQLMYAGRNGDVVALCITRTDEDGAGASQTKTEDGLTLIGKTRGNHIFIVVGPKGYPSLRAVADAVPELFHHS